MTPAAGPSTAAPSHDTYLQPICSPSPSAADPEPPAFSSCTAALNRDTHLQPSTSAAGSQTQRSALPLPRPT